MSIFSKLKQSLSKTRNNIGSGFLKFFQRKKIDNNIFNDLEEKLLLADVGIKTTKKIMDNVIKQTDFKNNKNLKLIYEILRKEMKKILLQSNKTIFQKNTNPHIILIVGVNGSGKTTTIGKLAHRYKKKGKSVILAAGDTFRAAAIDQLQIWAKKNNTPIVKQNLGSDPASVIFNSIQSAKSKKIDILIADTAGRLQNKTHLMEELKKIVKVIKKLEKNAPHEIIITLDSNTGQNAINQIKIFNSKIKLTGIILTKLDGTAKGGVIFSIANNFKIPIKYIGIGEKIEDLQKFSVNNFIEALFSK